LATFATKPFFSLTENFMKMTHSLAFICIAFACLQQADAQPTPYSDPDNAGGWVLNETVSDEFDGDSLNLDKWNNLGLDGNYFGEWKGRAPSQYNPENVSVSGGKLTIISRWDPTFKFSDSKCSNGFMYGKPAPVTTAGITTKAKFKYGYLEMRCKAADGPVSSSFWTTGAGGEIDVFEHYGENSTNPYSSKRFHASFHDWRKGSATFGQRIWTNDHQLDFRVADDFHIYGFEWDESYVKLFVDGRLVNCVTKQEMGDNWVAVNEQKVWIDSETFDWEVKPAHLKAADFADGREFIVDYCRVWQRKGASDGCESRTNLIANPGFETGERVWSGGAAMADDMHSGRRAALLEKSALIEQTVPVKPNTTYVLSAWAKSPNTNQADLWFNAYLGVKDYGNEKTDTRFFFPYYHQKSLQFTTGPKATTAVIYFTNDPHAKTAIIDDVELVEAPGPSE
jgi:beta-glucanase (GH16 family)